MNIGSYLLDAAERFGDSPSLVMATQRFTYAETQARVARVCGWLRAEAALEDGTRVAVLMWNRPELLEVMFATWQAGGVVVPINSRLVAGEVEYLLEDSQASVLFFDRAHDDVIDGLPPGLLERITLVSVDGSRRPVTTFEDALSSPAGMLVDRRPEDAAWLFYTSGTTGRPKGAVLTHGVLNFVTVAWCADLMPLTPDDVGIHAAPLSHGAGFHALALVLRGSKQVILTGHFDPVAFLESVEQHRVSNVWLVPTQIRMLTDAARDMRADTSSLRWVVYGAAPMYEEDLLRALDQFGPVFVQIFGQGETPMTATYLPARDHVPGSGRLTSCGFARSGLEIRVVDDNDVEVPRGSPGEICVRGPSVFGGYWNRPEETAEKLRGGWLHTGDIGYMDAAGYVFLLDRMSDMIISGGANVYPREVEDVLASHPAVVDVCVFGVPDDKWGESVHAAVVAAPGASISPEVLDAHCRAHLAGYKVPRGFDFIAALPRSAYGKTLRRVLREPYWVGESRMVR